MFVCGVTLVLKSFQSQRGAVMATCPKCNQHFQEPPGEEGEHGCPKCSLNEDACPECGSTDSPEIKTGKAVAEEFWYRSKVCVCRNCGFVA